MTLTRVIYTPNDYSPSYEFDVDETSRFVRLHHVWDIPPGYPGARDGIDDQRESFEAYIINAEPRWRSLAAYMIRQNASR